MSSKGSFKLFYLDLTSWARPNAVKRHTHAKTKMKIVYGLNIQNGSFIASLTNFPGGLPQDSESGLTEKDAEEIDSHRHLYVGFLLLLILLL